MKNSPIVKIDQNSFIAKGLYCECYESPTNKDQCIKIPLKHPKASKRLKQDIHYYTKLHKRKASLDYLANYLGGCKTSLGHGYLYECVRDHDQQISKRLQYYLDGNEIAQEALFSKMEELARYLLDNKILISDLHSRNILIQIRENGEFRPIIVDGIGDRVAITWLNSLPGVTESKISRRWNRFSNRELGGHAALK